MGKALKLLSKLEVKEFDWKHNNQHDVGLIAEEVKKVIPEAIIEDKFGNIIGLKPLTLIAIIIEAIKELQED